MRRRDHAARWLKAVPLPRTLGVRPALAAHVAARALGGRPLRRALLHAALLEGLLWTFGRRGMFTHGGSFYPLYTLPDFHGPHFDEALRRLILPGRGPFMVNLAVTGACPSRCSYCYASAGGDRPPDLGDEVLLDVARAIAAEGVPLVILGGGEPMARFERLLRLVAILSPACEVRVATSGVGLGPGRAVRLRDAGVSVVAVSLDSDDPAAVNAARGNEAAFGAAVGALRAAAGAGLVTLATTVVDRRRFRSRAEVLRFLAFVRSVHPAILVNFLPKFATGRAASTGGFLAPPEYAPTARLIARCIQECGARATVFHEPAELLMGCVGGGRRQMTIDIRGNATACISGASFGNVTAEPFAALRARFSSGDVRLKRGFFCASVGDRVDGGKVLEPDESVRALAAFYAAHPDTLVQRLLDVAGASLAWLAGAVDSAPCQPRPDASLAPSPRPSRSPSRRSRPASPARPTPPR